MGARLSLSSPAPAGQLLDPGARWALTSLSRVCQPSGSYPGGRTLGALQGREAEGPFGQLWCRERGPCMLGV